MGSLWTWLSLVHFVGVALAVGAATVKLVLLFRCAADPSFTRTFLAVARPITRLIITGLVLLTGSGIGWLLLGYPLDTVLIVKLCLVGAVWVMGPVIDKVVEPRFARSAPDGDAAPSPEFTVARSRYLAIELLATGTFYAIVVLWVWN